VCIRALDRPLLCGLIVPGWQLARDARPSKLAPIDCSRNGPLLDETLEPSFALLLLYGAASECV
jgi:hypothetical protein